MPSLATPVARAGPAGTSPEPPRSTSNPGLEVLRGGSGEVPARLRRDCHPYPREEALRGVNWLVAWPWICSVLVPKQKRFTMTLDQATDLIKSCAEQMNARYEKVVFDEWAVVSLAGRKGRLLAYNGPRKAGFQKNFLTDVGGLREGLLNKEYNVGDFEFARHGVGPAYESFMVVGQGTYLICNNTVQSMDSITKDPLWLGAQVPFVELSDKFRADPLTVAR